ncbi:hypothetical protein MKY24_13255 [Paenibacillus sp. FSL P2-0322]|uniref:hypothetical protein n=1 Tax=Paenibacillus sp. FSL P2-0322 TaxID=2921628 RepID=UPI0012D91473
MSNLSLAVSGRLAQANMEVLRNKVKRRMSVNNYSKKERDLVGLRKNLFKVTLIILSIIISIILLFIVYVTQVEKRSIQSKVIEISMSLSGLKNEPTQFKEAAINNNEKPYIIPKDVKFTANVELQTIDNMEVFSLSNKDQKSEKR